MIDDERLSAYLDNELEPDERATFERVVAADAGLRSALAEIGHVRDSVRALGPVDPPFAFFEHMVSRRQRWRRVVAAGAAALSVAAVVVLVLGLLSGTGAARVVPPLRDYLDQHAVAAADAEARASGAQPPPPVAGFEAVELAVAQRSAPDMAPMRLMSAFRHDSVMQFVYDDSAMGPLSLFVQSGRCACDRFDGGEMMPMPGYGDAWHGSGTDGRSIVVREGRLAGAAVVFTVIGRSTSDAGVVAVARHLG